MLFYVLNRMIFVFVVLLFDGVKNNFSDIFVIYLIEIGEYVEVFQFFYEGLQKFGVKIFQDVLVEIIIFSYFDYLFVMFQLMFSGVVQVYGGFIFWFIGFCDELEMCFLCICGQIVDICF